MCISVIGSLVSMLAPEGEGGGLGRSYRLILGLCVVLVSVNPIKSIVLGIKDLDIGSIVELPDTEGERYEDYFKGSYSAAEVESLKNGICQMLEERFSIPREDCLVEVSLTVGEGEERVLDSIRITLYGPSIFKNTTEIEDYFVAIFGCEIVTMIG